MSRRPPLSAAAERDMDATCRALADTRRRRILELLAEAPRRPTEIAAEFPEISRIAVRKHLLILEEAELVTVQPRGRERWYHFNSDPLRQLDSLLDYYRTYWTDKLDELKDLVEEDR